MDDAKFTVRAYHSIRLDRHDNGIEPRRAFTMAARWQPELDPPVLTDNGREARSVIANLGSGEDVSTATLDAAARWLDEAMHYYETTEPPMDGLRGPWKEAAGDMTEASRWLRQIQRTCNALPSELTVYEP